MDLREQADRDFGRARRRAFLRRLADRFRDEPLPAFDDLRRSLRAYNRVRRGVRVVETERIVGTVGRRADFDGSFMPLRSSVAGRWKRVDLAFLRGEDLPPVDLYKLGDAYFVLDGNHRVSVARYHGVAAIEAYVTGFRPARSRARRVDDLRGFRRPDGAGGRAA